eukprot:gnl/TRDRNA2_/TRDRNA2_132628_c0_seq2.p1 gnl/TRDRNA2_/TRDRNA2_132628_c0~~gnl/TRDRNA2_/TRDRNA2_132628_c0_seq2.p1  ORF type:complete len:433 (+),score=98.27 gnl/TRDRNA2_/TRDRNA2_132628_c0_seq2:89-1387(+)
MRVSNQIGCFLLMVAAASAARLRNSSSVKATKKQPYRQPLENFMNTQYFAHISIGGQDVKGIFDTGSFELLVRSTRCQSCAHPTTPYDRKKSSTYVKNGTLVKHVFGSGPCISTQGYETVSVGPLETRNMSFWEITQHKIPVLDQAKFAAIVGIGPHFAPNNDEKTLLMEFGVDEFAVCLQRGSGADGYLTWGPIATPQEKKLSFAAVPVVGELHWAARMTGVSMVDVHKRKVTALLDTKSVDVCGKEGCAAIVDSGTSLIAAPTAALEALGKQVGVIEEDCSNLNSLPTLRFNLGGNLFELPPHAYVMRIKGQVEEDQTFWEQIFFKPKVKKVDTCIPAFMKLDMFSKQGPVWILGMPFFRYYHTSFNRKERVMYMAPATATCDTTPYAPNGTALFQQRRAEDYQPMDIETEAIIPPTVSSMLDRDEPVVL